MNNTVPDRIFIDDWLVLPPEGLISRGKQTIRLEPKAMAVLAYLASRPGEVVTRDELEKDVWRGAVIGYDAVTSTIIKLRKALQDNARNPRYIATIPKRGYQLIAQVNLSPEVDPASRRTVEDQPLSDKSGNISSPTWSSWRKSLSVIFLAVLAISIFIVGLINTEETDESTLSTPENTVNRSPARLIVIPFKNISDLSIQSYVADAIATDIIIDLSRLSGLRIFDHHTSDNFRDIEISNLEIRKKLNADYILKGTVWQSGGNIRVSAQLINLNTGHNTWANRYDVTKKDLFSVHQLVVTGLISALDIKINKKEQYRLSQHTTNNLIAYDYFQKGQQISKSGTRESLELASELYRNAIQIDPSYGRAYGALAYILATKYRRGWTDNPLETIDRALTIAKQGVELDSNIPHTYWSLGYVYFMRKELDDAKYAGEQSVNVAPSYADGYALLALINNNLGNSSDAIELIKKAMALNPYYTWDYPFNLGVAYYFSGQLDKAITALEEAQGRNENAIPVKLYLAASYARDNQLEQAEWTVSELEILSPSATLSHTEKTIPIVKKEHKLQLLKDLRKAGLPD